MKKIILFIFCLFIYNNSAAALVEVDITRGNLDPLPIAVSPLHVESDSVDIKQGDKIFQTLHILPEETTSIHIRRGDYLNKTKFHPVQPVEYFKTAISELKSKNYLFFSDDIEWCKKVYGKNPGVYFSEGNNPFVDMYAMSKCNDNIIVNSSFSWWAAWLNRNNNKRVIAPKNWFGPSGIQKGYNSKDIIPENWIKI